MTHHLSTGAGDATAKRKRPSLKKKLISDSSPSFLDRMRFPRPLELFQPMSDAVVKSYLRSARSVYHHPVGNDVFSGCCDFPPTLPTVNGTGII